MAHVLYDAIININLHRFDWVGSLNQSNPWRRWMEIWPCCRPAGCCCVLSYARATCTFVSSPWQAGMAPGQGRLIGACVMDSWYARTHPSPSRGRPVAEDRIDEPTTGQRRSSSVTRGRCGRCHPPRPPVHTTSVHEVLQDSDTVSKTQF